MFVDQINFSEKQLQEHTHSHIRESVYISKIHIIIPVFNESITILDSLSRIKRTMIKHYDFQKTVIDDGCSDNTYFLLKCSVWKINLIGTNFNFGKGKTLENGFFLANSKQIVVMIDGGGEHPPEEIPKLIEPIILVKADLVIGSRFLDSKLKEYY